MKEICFIALKSIPVQITAAVLLIAGAGKLLGPLDMCGTALFLVLLMRALRREKRKGRMA